MKNAVKKGFSFGLTSGVITTLGLMVGLEASTSSKLAVLGGIIAIAVADAFSDSLGMHISEEATKHPAKEVWQSTFSTFFAKFFFAMTFAVPVLFFSLATAVIISAVWGISLIGIFSVYMAKLEKISAWKTVFEHVGIAIVVIILTHYLGHFIKTLG